MEKVKDLLISIYGEQTGALALERIVPIIENGGLKKERRHPIFPRRMWF